MADGITVEMLEFLEDAIGTEYSSRLVPAQDLIFDYISHRTPAELEIEMTFDGFTDYWSPFLGRATATSSYAATLPEDEQAALRALLRDRLLGDGSDRPFSLPARAWAVRGKVL